MPNCESMIALSGLTAGYGGPPIVHGIDLSIARGTLTTFVGPNGAGKSTLLRALFGVAKTYSGAITYEGARVEELSPLKRYERGISFVPQGRCNFGQMSVAENLEIAAHAIPRTKRAHARAYVFDLFPVLQSRYATMAGNLSGGEQQLLEMAMVLQMHPKCLLVDEPSLGLSPKMQVDLFQKLKALRDAGMTVIVVEQNVKSALAVSDYAAVLVQGKIVMHSVADEILNDDRIRVAYLGG